MGREQTTLAHVHEALAAVAEAHERAGVAHSAAVADVIAAVEAESEQLRIERDADRG